MTSWVTCPEHREALACAPTAHDVYKQEFTVQGGSTYFATELVGRLRYVTAVDGGIETFSLSIVICATVGWRMSCDAGEVTESLENQNELWRRWSDKEWAELYTVLYTMEQSSFSKLSVTSPTSQLILQPFHRFTYVTAHSPALPSLHLCHSSFSNPSFASPASQALHLKIHFASRPCLRKRALHNVTLIPKARNWIFTCWMFLIVYPHNLLLTKLWTLI